MCNSVSCIKALLMSTPTARNPDPFDVEVGARVRTVRKSKGISQSDLATAAGITFQQVQKYERGANRVSASMLQRIARHLGVSMAELLGEGPGSPAGAVDWSVMVDSEAVEIARAVQEIRSPGVKRRLRTLIKLLAERKQGDEAEAD